MTKKEIRSRMLMVRAALPEEEIRQMSSAMARHIRALPLWKTADTILSYCAVRGEADPLFLTEEALREGKRVYLPKVRAAQMTFLRYEAGDVLIRSRYGIPEPADTDAWDGTAAALVLVPGAAFSPDGQRIGYGGGYYDRYFADPALRGRCTLIGLAYAFQITDEILPEAHDVRLDGIACENGMRML